MRWWGPDDPRGPDVPFWLLTLLAVGSFLLYAWLLKHGEGKP